MPGSARMAATVPAPVATGTSSTGRPPWRMPRRLRRVTASDVGLVVGHEDPDGFDRHWAASSGVRGKWRCTAVPSPGSDSISAVPCMPSVTRLFTTARPRPVPPMDRPVV